MARKRVTEVQCDRCKRVEYKDVEVKASGGHPDEPVLLLNYWDEPHEASRVKVSFDDLCTPCKKTVRGYIEKIAKELEGKSPERGAKEKGQPDEPTAPTPEPVKPASETASSPSASSARARRRDDDRPTSEPA